MSATSSKEDKQPESEPDDETTHVREVKPDMFLKKDPFEDQISEILSNLKTVQDQLKVALSCCPNYKQYSHDPQTV